MKKYKLSCPFGGYGLMTFVISVTCAVLLLKLLPALLHIQLETSVFIAGYFGLIILSFIAVAIWTHRITDEDRENIANAENPEWTEANEDFLKKIYADVKLEFFITLFIAGLAMIFVAIPVYLKQKNTYGILVEVAVILFMYIRMIYWKNPPCDMEMTSVEIKRKYRIFSFRRGYKARNTVAVYYLPSGRYFALYSDENIPDRIYFVKRNGIIFRLKMSL